VVHDWVPGEVLSDPLAPGGLPRENPRSAFARFRRLPVPEVLAAYGTVLDAHRALAGRGFVAVDFYDGCLIYDFAPRTMWLCDLDCYRPAPTCWTGTVSTARARFMVPEESAKSATVDERSTVFTLGRAAFVLLSRGPRGVQDRDLWRAGDVLFQVATTATRPRPAHRYQSVAELIGAWQDAHGNRRPWRE